VVDESRREFDGRRERTRVDIVVPDQTDHSRCRSIRCTVSNVDIERAVALVRRRSASACRCSCGSATSRTGTVCRAPTGPYRVAPNLMVVVPHPNTVELTYGRSPIDYRRPAADAAGDRAAACSGESGATCTFPSARCRGALWGRRIARRRSRSTTMSIRGRPSRRTIDDQFVGTSLAFGSSARRPRPQTDDATRGRGHARRYRRPTRRREWRDRRSIPTTPIALDRVAPDLDPSSGRW
jgi:hypothetical protein